MKTRFFLSVFLVLVFVATSALNTSTVLAGTVCDSDYVNLDGNTISVKPTGVEDTANLQCAFDLAVGAGPGMEVTLTEGTFYTAQIVVNDFHGGFSGAGAEKTVIHNVQEMYVTPADFILAPPSAENPWPSLFTFFNGAYTIHDLSILVIGTPTTPWTIWGWPLHPSLLFGIGVIGSHADVVVRDIIVKGEVSTDNPDIQPWWANLFNGIYMWGLDGDTNPPISGSLLIERSIFGDMAYGTPVASLVDMSVTITHNIFTDNWLAMDGYDMERSTLVFAHNKVLQQHANPMPRYGVAFYNIALPEITGSTFLFKNNQFEGEIGIDFEPILGTGNSCLFLGNNVQRVTDYPIYLGSGTHDCMVVGGNTKANVIDMGTNNILVGVNNMGTGVGPTIRDFLSRKRP
jgi:hypothetical protein